MRKFVSGRKQGKKQIHFVRVTASHSQEICRDHGGPMGLSPSILLGCTDVKSEETRNYRIMYEHDNITFFEDWK